MSVHVETSKTHRYAIDTREEYEKDIAQFEKNLRKVKSGEMPWSDFRPFRLHFGIYGQRESQPGYNMIRIKIPAGILTAEQLRKIGSIAAEYADGLGHITTRQDIQLHWVKIDTVPAVMRDLISVGLTTREACGQSVRNIVASPIAGVSGEEVFDVSPYAMGLAKFFLRNEKTQALPRKFKISFSGSEVDRDGIIPWIHDIGFVAAKQGLNGSTRYGFKVYIGGGLGANVRIADVLDEFVPVEHFAPTAEAILTIFNRHGNHAYRLRGRLKFLIWNIGIHEFRKLVQEERERIIAAGSYFSIPVQDGEQPPSAYVGERPPVADFPGYEFDFWKQTNVFHQKQRGYNLVYVNPEIGDLTVEQFNVLADISERYSDGEVRTSATQDIVLRWIRTGDLKNVYSDLRRTGLHAAGADSIANVTTCPGADTCNLGITHSRALGRELTALFQKNSGWAKVLRDLRIKISGCPNSCGQHHVASIGLYGCSRKIGERHVPHYILSLGGGLHSGESMYGTTVMKVPARRVTDAILRIITFFLSERRENENFWTYVKRVDPRSFKKRLIDLAYIPTYEEAPEWYVDLGESEEYAPRTGLSECMS